MSITSCRMSGLNLRFSVPRAKGEHTAVGLVAVVAATVAVFAPGQPTEILVWDVFLKALLAVAVVVAASKAPRWAIIVMASIAAAFGGLSGWGLLAWLALAIAIGAGLLARRSRLVIDLSRTFR